MGLLTKRGPVSDPRVDDLLRQVSALSSRLDSIEKKYDEIDVEWSSWFDKFRMLYQRLAKRESRARKDEPEPENGPARGLTENPLALKILQSSPLLGRD